MATSIVVPGPCKIQMGATAAALSDLGYSDNDDLPNFRVERLNEVIESVNLGREAAEIVYVGSTGIVNFSLVEWDPAEAAELFIPPGGTTEGDAGVIGTRWVQDQKVFAISIIPITASRKSYTFPRCWADAEAFQMVDFGNLGQRLIGQAMVMRNHDAGALGDGASATDDLYTTATTS